MPKRRTYPTLTLAPREGGTPATHWLYDALRTAVLDGRLRPGARLPATRELADQYGLARGTIVSAFDHLRAEGYIEARVGSGTYVARTLPDQLLKAGRTPSPGRTAARSKRRRLSGYAERLRTFPEDLPGPVHAFRANEPALDLFPTTLWAQVAGRRVRRSTQDVLRGCGPLGYRPLREAVADYLTTSRGVHCDAGSVAIVSGVQEALNLVTRVLLEPGDVVALEDPGYVGAALVFDAAGARVTPVPVDEQGMEVDPTTLAGARLVYVTPAHQFPLGTTMSLPRRLALLELAALTGAVIFEDDYDSEYRYVGRPMPALQGLDPSGQVLFAGSFAKVLFPSLRLGYLVLPDDLIDPFASALSLGNRHAPLLEQAILADFITGGHFARHVRRMREVYASRRAVLLRCADDRLRGLLEISGVEAGLQTAAWLPPGIDAEAVAREAAAHDVEVTPLSRYARRPMRRDGLHLGFAAVTEGEIERGVGKLAEAVEALVGRGALARRRPSA